MVRHDQHVHSRHSFDSDADPAVIVEGAIARGLTGLTFTEHFDTHPDDWETCVYNDESYDATIENLRDRFADRIFIGKGIEVCYQPAEMEFILGFLEKRSFDLVILSIHYFGEDALFRRNNWNGITAREITGRYLQNVLQAVQDCAQIHKQRGRVFDVLGHIDLVKRYSQRFAGQSIVSDFREVTDDILRACMSADLTPEFNTSTLRQGMDESMPGQATVRRYAELGGTSMAVGSDAHIPEDVGHGLELAGRMLQAANLRTALFQKRRKTEVVVG